MQNLTFCFLTWKTDLEPYVKSDLKSLNNKFIIYQ